MTELALRVNRIALPTSFTPFFGVSESGMVLVECVMDKYDAPYDLVLGGHAIADTDYGVRGPQSAVNAQIPLPTR